MFKFKAAFMKKLLGYLYFEEHFIPESRLKQVK